MDRIWAMNKPTSNSLERQLDTQRILQVVWSAMEWEVPHMTQLVTSRYMSNQYLITRTWMARLKTRMTFSIKMIVTWLIHTIKIRRTPKPLKVSVTTTMTMISRVITMKKTTRVIIIQVVRKLNQIFNMEHPPRRKVLKPRLLFKNHIRILTRRTLQKSNKTQQDFSFKNSVQIIHR